MNRPNAESLPRTFAALVAMHMPRPIHGDGEYSNTAEILDVLAIGGDALNAEQRDYLDMLTAEAITPTSAAHSHSPPSERSMP